MCSIKCESFCFCRQGEGFTGDHCPPCAWSWHAHVKAAPQLKNNACASFRLCFLYCAHFWRGSVARHQAGMRNPCLHARHYFAIRSHTHRHPTPQSMAGHGENIQRCCCDGNLTTPLDRSHAASIVAGLKHEAGCGPADADIDAAVALSCCTKCRRRCSR